MSPASSSANKKKRTKTKGAAAKLERKVAKVVKAAETKAKREAVKVIKAAKAKAKTDAAVVETKPFKFASASETKARNVRRANESVRAAAVAAIGGGGARHQHPWTGLGAGVPLASFIHEDEVGVVPEGREQTAETRQLDGAFNAAMDAQKRDPRYLARVLRLRADHPAAQHHDMFGDPLLAGAHALLRSLGHAPGSAAMRAAEDEIIRSKMGGAM